MMLDHNRRAMIMVTLNHHAPVFVWVTVDMPMGRWYAYAGVTNCTANATRTRGKRAEGMILRL
jgi:hypothetical protein